MIDSTYDAQLRASLLGFFAFNSNLNSSDGKRRGDLWSEGASFVPGWGGYRCLETDPGTPSRIRLADLHFSLPPNKRMDYAISLWFQLPPAIVSDHHELYNDPAMVIHVRKDWKVQFGISKNPLMVADLGLVPGVWYHLAVSYSALDGNPPSLNRLKVWLNGGRAGVFEVGPYVSPLPFTFPDWRFQGGKYCFYSMFSQALTDDLAVYLALNWFHPGGANNAWSPTADYLEIGLQPNTVVQCVDSPRLDPADAPDGITVAAWLRNDGLDLYSESILKIVERKGSFIFGVDEDARLFGVAQTAPGETTTVVSTKPVTGFDDWIYVALTIGNEQLNLFINGEKVGSAALATMAKVSSTTVELGRNWPSGIYSVELYDRAFDLRGILKAMNATVDPKDPASLKNLLVYYDFSGVPATAISPFPELRALPIVPGDADHIVVSNSVGLGINGYVDCGAAADTQLAISTKLHPSAGTEATALESEPQVITIAAWVYPLATDGTIASRECDGVGYSLYLKGGTLGFRVSIGGGKWLYTESTFVLPLNRWMQLGATLIILHPDELAWSASITLFADGAILNERVLLSWKAPQIAEVPFAIGARFQSNTEQDGATIVACDGFSGFIQRLTFFNGEVDPRALFLEGQPAATLVVGDWMFDIDTPTDVVGDHPAVLMGGAALDTAHEVIPREAAERLGLRDNASRLSHWHAARTAKLAALAPPIPAVAIPEAHRELLVTTEERRNRILVHTIDDRRYLVAYPEEMGALGEIALVTDPDDPYPEWVPLVIDVAALALSIWGLKAPSATKAVKVGQLMWRNGAVRDAFLLLVAAQNAEVVASAFVSFGRTLYREGLFGALLSCFSISWFTIARIASFFAPWIGFAAIVAQFILIGNDIYELVKTRKPNEADPGVKAKCGKQRDVTGRVPVVVNGNSVTVNVSLDSPPTNPVSVRAVVEGNLQCVPTALVFATMAPQQVQVRCVSASNDGLDTPAIITWTGGRTSAAIAFSVNFARVECQPSEVELKKVNGQYEATVMIDISEEITVPVTVTFSDDSGKNVLTYDPPQMVFQPQNIAQVRTPGQQLALKRKAQDMAPDTVNLNINAQTQQHGPANGTRSRAKVTKPARSETVRLSVVEASYGNCYVLQNTETLTNGQATTKYAVIDGGVPGTYENMAYFLPDGTIDLVFCTHYDSDHIGGLIELMKQRGSSVGKVVFNPPPQLTAEQLDAALPLVPLRVFSVGQGACLKKLAGNKLLEAHDHFTAPPNKTLDNISLPTLDIRFAGPSDLNYQKNQDRPLSGPRINRASLLFLLQSNLTFGFRMLVTGDGYNKFPLRLDVQGYAPFRSLVHILQVPHHGSRANSDRFLYWAFPTDNYLISTDYKKYHHPDIKLVQEIVDANRKIKKTGYKLWITASALPDDYINNFPGLMATNPDEYFVYTLKDGWHGSTFTFQGNALVPNLLDWDKRTLPVGMRQ